MLVKLSRSCDVANLLSSRFKLVDHPRIRIKPDLSRRERRIESILLKERRNLIDSGVDRKSIKIKGNSLVVNHLKFGVVTDSGFQLCADRNDHEVPLDGVDVAVDNSSSDTDQVNEPFLGVH